MKPGEKKEAVVSKKDGKNRGTTDELEALVLIINENIGLKARVMEKIRAVRDEKSKRDAKMAKKSAEQT